MMIALVRIAFLLTIPLLFLCIFLCNDLLTLKKHHIIQFYTPVHLLLQLLVLKPNFFRIITGLLLYSPIPSSFLSSTFQIASSCPWLESLSKLLILFKFLKFGVSINILRYAKMKSFSVLP